MYYHVDVVIVLCEEWVCISSEDPTLQEPILHREEREREERGKEEEK